jgi:hypothetical protein
MYSITNFDEGASWTPTVPHPISRKEREMTKMYHGLSFQGNLSFSREDDEGYQHLVVP